MTTRLEPWKVKGSRYLLRERFLTARVDHCVTPAGIEVPYYVLEYPGWVNVVALDKEDHLILVRQYRHALGDISLELPGAASMAARPRLKPPLASFWKRQVMAMQAA